MEKIEKERIVQLYAQWCSRSGLKTDKILARIQTYGIDISRDQFNNRLVRTDRMMTIEPELTFAIVATFTEGLPQRERCTLEEAKEFADLARLPHSQLKKLEGYFPASDNLKADDSPSPAIQDEHRKDHISNPPSPLPAVAERPPDDFVGREEALEQISEALLKGQSTAITALQGMGGIGKTALAQMLAERLKDHFKGGIFWADLAGHNGSAEPILRAWGAMCGADLSQEPDRNVLVQLVRGLLAQRQQQYGPLLAVVDDVRTEPAWLSTAGILRQTLPADTPLLLTARNEGLTEELADYTWRVDLLTQNESWTLLTKRVRNEALLQPIETVHQLLAALGYLPLAIRLAAGYLNGPKGRKLDFQLITFVQQVEKAAAKILDTRTAGLVATFQISYEALDDTEQRVFRYLSVYSDPLLTVEHMAALLKMDTTTTEDSLDILVEAAMLDIDRKVARRYRLHPLLRQYSYELLQEDDGASAIHRAAAVHLKDIAEQQGLTPSEMLEEVDQWLKAEEWETCIKQTYALVGNLDRAGYWSEIEHQLVQAQNALPYVSEENRYDLEAMVWNGRGIIAYTQAQWDNAISHYEKLFVVAERLGDVDGIRSSYNNLGLVYQTKGEWDKATKHYERSLEICEQSDDAYGIAQSKANLGIVYADKGEWDKAIEYHEDSLQIFKNLENIHCIAKTYNNLGLVYTTKGEWDKAIHYHKQDIEISEQMDDIHSMASAYNNLGNVYQAKEEWDKAIDYYERSLQIDEHLGDIHGIAKTYNNLGSVYLYKEELDNALSYYEQSLQTKKQVGDIHGTAQTYNNLGNVYQAKEEWLKAIDYYEQSLQLEEGLGDVHGIANTHSNLGNIYYIKGEWDKAIGYYEQAVQIFEQAGEIENCAEIYINLSAGYGEEGDWDKAIDYCKLSLQMFEQVGDIQGIAQTYGNLGVIYANKEQWNKAIKYYKQALKRYKRVNDIEGCAQIYNSLGGAYISKKRWRKAISYYKQALQILEQGDDIQSVAQTYENFGLAYFFGKKDWDKAINYYQQSLHIYEQIDNFQGIAQTYNYLGMAYVNKEEWEKANDYYHQSLKIYKQMNDIHGITNTWMDIGIMLLEQDRLEDAKPLFVQALLKLSEIGIPDTEVAEIGLMEACGSEEAAKAYFEEYMATTDLDISEIDEKAAIDSEAEDDAS